jgi:NADPH:quinone reductase-like Zn-dependent oxidoreductase
MVRKMRAAVVYEPGGPEVLQLEDRPLPKPEAGWIRIAVKAFGLNRSELFTRQGHSPSVQFPRILGIEAVGIVDAAPSGEFAVGDVVATVMGGMGRQYDGGYAEFTCVPAKQVRKISSTLPWEMLGAIPEMFQTAWGSLNSALKLQANERLLVRGGTTSVGLAAISLAAGSGAKVWATTRQESKAKLLKDMGAHYVLVDDGHLAKNEQRFDKVLELVGTTTLEDSLGCTARDGLVCMSGIVGGSWSLNSFAPMDAIPNRVSLTTYSGEPEDFMEMPLQAMINDVASGKLKVPVGKVFSLSQIVEAHECMEQNAAAGKIVVLI